MRAADIFYLGAPALQSGEMQGEIAAEICLADFAAVDKDGDGIVQYVMLEGQAGHQDAILRTESSIETFIKEGFRVEKLEDAIANWSRAQAETHMTLWLSQHDNIEIVFANNDEMAIGAFDAIDKSVNPPYQSGRPVILGIDGTPAGLEALINGNIDGTVFNDAPRQAQAMLALVLYCTLGIEPPVEFAPDESKAVYIDYRPITKENAHEFLKLYEE
jgi:methyl-galactoside transport system substrate-binding protein